MAVVFVVSERDWWSNESSLAPWPLWTDVVVNPSSGIFSLSPCVLYSSLLLLLSIDRKPIALLVFPHSLLPAQSLSHLPLYFQNLGASICLVRVHFSSIFSCYFQHDARVFANVNINQQPAGHCLNVSLAVNWPGREWIVQNSAAGDNKMAHSRILL